MVQKITRREEAQLPSFNSHEEARAFFKERYGDDFIMIGSETIMGEKCYFYYILLDKAAFEEGTKKLQAGIYDASFN